MIVTSVRYLSPGLVCVCVHICYHINSKIPSVLLRPKLIRHWYMADNNRSTTNRCYCCYCCMLLFSLHVIVIACYCSCYCCVLVLLLLLLHLIVLVTFACCSCCVILLLLLLLHVVVVACYWYFCCYCCMLLLLLLLLIK